MLALTRVKSYLEIRKDISNLKLKCSNKSKQCGGACIPKTHKCQLTANQLREVVEEAENQIKDLPYERAIAFNSSNGRVVLSSHGNSNSVTFSAEEVNRMRRAIVTHNHPNQGWGKNDPRSKGLSFSSSDVELACKAEMKEVRAVTNGYRHSLKPASTGWNKKYWDKQVKPIYNKYARQVYREFAGNILSGKVNIDQAEADYHHEVIKRTAKQLSMTYSRTNI